MLETYNKYKKEHPRLTNNIILTLISLIGCLVAVVLALPTQPLLEALAVGTGYVGLGLLALTLLIGPINMLKVRKNPVNLNFRRDAGIWAGIMSLLHVLLVFALEINWGGTLLGYFLYKDGSLKLNLFGISNYIGLAATFILIFLLVLSNNHFLKALKGKKWKNMQRFNYLLFALVVGHTFTQQVNNVRGLWMVLGALVVTVAVLVGQAIGFKIYRKREQERKVTTPAAKPVPAKVAAAPITAPAKVAVPTTPAPAASVATPAQPAQVAGGSSKLKVASAVGLLAMLGVGAGIEGINLLNTPVTAQTGSVTTDQTTTSNTSSSSTDTTTATTTVAATTTTSASSSSTTTVSNASSRSGSAHTGGS